jgi:hypothetical protein
MGGVVKTKLERLSFSGKEEDFAFLVTSLKRGCIF